MAMEMLIKFIEKTNEWIGKIASFLIVPLVVLIVINVVMRYIFKTPSDWGFEFSIFLYGMFFMLSGAYILKLNAHVAVDILPEYLSYRGKKILEIVSNSLILIFSIFLVWKGYEKALKSTFILETSIHQTAFDPQIWWFRWVIPISGLLLLLQSITNIYKSTIGIRNRRSDIDDS